MAQHDYTIANQGFPATRADINNALSAIATNNSGTSAPSTQYAGQFWIDTTSSTWTLYIHDGTDDIQFATIDTSANTVNFTDSALDVVTDTTPQLGGDLDANGNNILFNDATGINDDDDNELIRFQKTSSAVNQIDITNSATGNAPEISATGDDTNIDLNLTPKGTGSIIIPNGKITGQNYPAFDAHLSSDQSMSDAVTTKIQCDTEVYDTNNCYDTSTYRFTPNVAGKYFVYGACNGYGGTLTNVASQAIYLYKNGSVFRLLSFGFSANYVEASSPMITAVVDMNGTTDYLELFVNINVVTGSPVAIGSTQRTFFGAYRLGA